MINAQKGLAATKNVGICKMSDALMGMFGSPIIGNPTPQISQRADPPFEDIEPAPVYTPQKLANDAAYDSKMPASASKIPGAPLSEQPFQFGNVHAPAPAAGTLPNFETVPRTASGLPAGGGLFGGPSAPAPAPGTLPNFGNVPRTASGLPAGGAAAPTPAGGLFGGPPAPAPAAAPTPAGGGLSGGAPAPAPATQSLGDMFKADESTWKCNECYVRTKKGKNNCKACGTVRPGFETTDAAGGSSVSTADAQQASEQKENKNKRRRTQAGTGSKRFRRE